MDVVVVGSANMDFMVPVERSPRAGETLLGGLLARHPGGKGANQAVASARSGGVATAFIGALGDDAEGAQLRASLQNAGVDTTLVTKSELPTGVALIWVTPAGENTIIVAPGANAQLALTNDHRHAIAEAQVVLAQLEIPLETVAAIGQAKGPASVFMLNAAPSADLPHELLEVVDVLVVNEHEAADLSGVASHPERAAMKLLESVPAVVVTLGADGALVVTREIHLQRIPAHRVAAVDTTGAGDAFCGVLAAGLAQGLSLVDAARLSSAGGALATLAPGAQESMPTPDEVQRLAHCTSPAS